MELEGIISRCPSYVITSLSLCSRLGLNADSTLGLDGRSVVGGGIFFFARTTDVGTGLMGWRQG